MKNNLFREKSIKKISSPEQINDYIKTSNLSIWIIFSAVVILLIGAVTWAVFGELEIAVSSVTVCDDGKAYCYISENDMEKITDNAYARIEGNDYVLDNISKLPVPALDVISSYGLHIGNFESDEWVYTAEIESTIEDGIYRTNIIVESVSPISLLMN
jgi:hypothetical protein